MRVMYSKRLYMTCSRSIISPCLHSTLPRTYKCSSHSLNYLFFRWVIQLTLEGYLTLQFISYAFVGNDDKCSYNKVKILRSICCIILWMPELFVKLNAEVTSDQLN